MSIVSFGDDGSDFNPKGMYKDLIDGIHHVRLESTDQNKIETGPETLKGNPQIIWKFKVMDGPSKGSGLWYSSPVSGYIVPRDNPSARINMANYTRRVVAALDPLWSNFQEFDLASLIGKEAEINITTKKNNDGTTSLWAAKVLWIRPFFNNAGASILQEKIEKRKEEVIDPTSVHF